MIGPDPTVVQSFWRDVRGVRPELPAALPEAWAFGATPEYADGLLALVLDGIKTGTASSLWEYEASSDLLPREGEISIIRDGAGAPRAVVETTDVRTVPFDQVTVGVLARRPRALPAGAFRELARIRDRHARRLRAIPTHPSRRHLTHVIMKASLPILSGARPS